MRLGARVVKNTRTMQIIVGTTFICVGATFLTCCLGCGVWSDTQPLWPGLDAPPGLDGQRASAAAHARELAIILIADFVLGAVIIFAGIGVLNRWRWMMGIAAAWCVAACASATARAVLTMVVLDDQLQAIENTQDATAVEGIGEVGIVLFAIFRGSLVLLVVAGIMMLWLARRRNSADG